MQDVNGPCMCGDPFCPFCSVFYGNSKCPVCGKWSMDGGCDNPKHCNTVLVGWESEADSYEVEGEPLFSNDLDSGE